MKFFKIPLRDTGPLCLCGRKLVINNTFSEEKITRYHSAISIAIGCRNVYSQCWFTILSLCYFFQYATISSGVFVAPSAAIVGEVTIKSKSSVCEIIDRKIFISKHRCEHHRACHFFLFIFFLFSPLRSGMELWSELIIAQWLLVNVPISRIKPLLLLISENLTFQMK